MLKNHQSSDVNHFIKKNHKEFMNIENKIKLENESFQQLLLELKYMLSPPKFTQL